LALASVRTALDLEFASDQAQPVAVGADGPECGGGVIMRRNTVVVSAIVALLMIVPVALAADSDLTHTGRVLVSTGGDITLPAGDQADVVVVVRGHATIAGAANTVVVVDGSADFTGARTETIVAVRSPVTVGAGTVVLGDVMKVDSVVTQVGDAQVKGTVRDLALDFAGVGLVLGPLFIALYAGFAIAAAAAALLLAALAGKQVRAAEAIIRREPGAVIVAGLAGIFLPILVVAVLFVTVIGAPLGLGILLGLWPFAAFVGYLVAAIALGEWIIGKVASGPPRERPYAAAVVGVLVLQVLAIWPVLTGIATFVGFGAVLLLAWRTLRGTPVSRTVMRGTAVPSAGAA
jgi:hypothetical protein